MAWVYYIFVLVLQLAGLFANLLGLPGLWLMVGSVGVFAWLTRYQQFVSNITLVVLVLIALTAEVVEFIAGSAGAKKAGGSRSAMIGAVVGGLLGGFFLTFVPIPIISTIVGVCLGAFIGAAVVEMVNQKDVGHSVRVGLGAAQGRFYGIVLKLIFGLVIFAIVAFATFPVRSKAPLTVGGKALTTIPTSVPSTAL